MRSRRDFLALSASAASGALLCPRFAFSESYPARLVRIIIPSGAGAPDTVARIIAQQLQAQLKQSFIVENRPAASGIVATDAVVKAAPDGYTLLVPSTSIVVNHSIYRSLPYNILTDLEPITAICKGDGYILVVHPGLQVQSVQELVAFAGEPKNKLSYGSPGVGNVLHLAAELFKARTGAEMTHVPYRGTGSAINDVMSGQIDLMFVTSPLAIEHIKAGKLRALAYTSAERRPLLPDVPTMAEAGIDNFVMDGGWFGLFAPGKTPAPIVMRLSEEVRTTLATLEVQATLGKLGLYPFANSPSEFKSFVCEQVELYSDLVRIAKIEPI